MRPTSKTHWRPILVGPGAFWRTLRFRFAWWVASLLLVVQIALGMFVYTRLKDRLLDMVDDTLRLNAVQLRALIEAQPGPLNPPDPAAYSSLSADLQEQRLTARLLKPDGEVMQAYGIYRTNPVDQRLLTAAQHRQDYLITQDDPGEPDEHIRILAVPVIKQGELVGIVEVTQSLESVDDTLEQLLMLFQISLPVSLIVAALGGYGLAARALARMDRITDMARRISAEDLSARLDLPATQDEVGRLAQTFDSMLERLQAAFLRERQFTSDASHELRTPLAAMRTILDLTRSKPRTTEDYERALDDLTEETVRLQILVADLLRLARSETPDPAKYDPVDLSALLNDLADSLRPIAEAKGLRLICSVPVGLYVPGDRDQLIRLFVNLVENAIKFTSSGRISLSAQPEANQPLKVIVADTGCGIAAEHLPHIFERFYRADASRSSAGSGLGLALALNIAHAHGGTIDVSSTVGQGSTFTVSFKKSSG
jgi:heavy metal sensor kinase